MKQLLALLMIASSVQSYACPSTPVKLRWSEVFGETTFALDTNRISLKTGNATDQFEFDEARRTWTYMLGGKSTDLPAGFEGDVSLQGRTISRVTVKHNGSLVFKSATGTPGNALTNKCCDVVVAPLEGRSLQMTFYKNGTQLSQVKGPSGMVKSLDPITNSDRLAQSLEVSDSANRGTYQASCGGLERIEAPTSNYQPGGRRVLGTGGSAFQ